MIRRTLAITLMGLLMSTFTYADELRRYEEPPEQCIMPCEIGKDLATSRTIPIYRVPSNTENLSIGEIEGYDTVDFRTVPAPDAAPFRISVDGVPIDTNIETDGHTADIQRVVDLELEAADIRIRYDSLEQTPWLNIHATPDAATRGRTVRFISYSNYDAWIERAEIRIFNLDRTIQQEPLEILPAKPNGTIEWTLPETGNDKLIYVLRVYDAEGRFDETRPEILILTRLPEEEPERTDDLAGYGENSRNIINIPVRGGAVTADGRGIKKGHKVKLMGALVPVDAAGKFAARQILPAGPHTVTVSVTDKKGVTREFTRNISIADEDWFYIGFADLTLGKNDTNGKANIVTDDPNNEYDNKIFINGRLAFFLKGKIKGKYLLKASADTREQPISTLFKNFNSKDPRYLLRRLDPDRYYPVYGDDSTAVEDAPTQGKFFVRLERDESHIMWGNFMTTVTNTEFAQYSRGLYGAKLRLESSETTKYGEKRGLIDTFAADPGTLPAREDFRGTGGSLYYMQRQEITEGSERAWIEIRDKDTGLVLETRYLAPVQDYDINYLQGRITLREALSSTASSSTIVSTSSLSGHPAYLVVTYEYAASIDPTEDMVLGGRTQYWVNDHVRLGMTGYRQKAVGMKQKIQEGDIILRYKPGTYFKYELARSEGTGSGETSSIDGGYNFNSVTASGDKADAQHIEAAIDFSEVSDNEKGQAKFYRMTRKRGFSGFGQIAPTTSIQQHGMDVDWEANEKTDIKVKIDERDDEYLRFRAAEINATRELSDAWTVGVGLRGDSRNIHTTGSSTILNKHGDRTDLTLKAKYTSDPSEQDDKKEGNKEEKEKEDAQWSAHTFIQGTLDRSGTRDRNNRAGIGGERRLTDRFVINGEISDGDTGLGALVSGDYQINDRTNIYTNYEMSTDRTDTGYRGRHGLFTSGANMRYSDSVTVFAEERMQHGDGPSGLTHAFGLDLAPDDRWTYGLKAETGHLSDPAVGDMERQAIGMSVGYHYEETKYAGNLEFRNEDGTAGDRETWLFRNNLGYQIDPSWRYIGRLNASFSLASAGDYWDGKYVEFVNGFAYRPINHDKYNGLFKYTYFYDLPSPEQLSAGGALADYSQQSHVLSADGMYDVRPWLSVGGKYGLRIGQLRDNRTGGEWFTSKAQLFILRSDIHWVHEWDIIAEARLLKAEEARDKRSGALIAIHRHINKNIKVGVGYNFSEFSDDLTDLSYDNSGWFLNIIMKM